MLDRVEDLLCLLLTKGLGRTTIWKLLKYFGNARSILEANEKELVNLQFINKKVFSLILEAKKIDPRPQIEKAINNGIRIIAYDDREYPEILKNSFDPPVLLYVKGKILPKDQVAVGIVGTRAVSKYGKEQAIKFSYQLSKAGFTIISGLARGIDTFAHNGALDAHGRTIGVLGCGFDHMYPRENIDLFAEIVANGAVISELPMEVAPTRETFPARNRIIAGLSLGILVVEAPEKSGALITARQANELGRLVFAIPGPIDVATCGGGNKLIKKGAIAVTSIDDIITELNPMLSTNDTNKNFNRIESAKSKKIVSLQDDKVDFLNITTRNSHKTENLEITLTELERVVFDCLSKEWKSIDEIITECKQPAGKVSAALTTLSLKKIVEQQAGQMFRFK